MLFFAASLSEAGAMVAGDGLPPDCCHFVSDIDAGEFLTTVTMIRSAGGNSPYAKIGEGNRSQPVATPATSSVWFGNLEMFKVSSFESCLQPQDLFEFEIPETARAQWSIVSQAFFAEARDVLSASIRQQSAPLPVRALRLLEQVVRDRSIL